VRIEVASLFERDMPLLGRATQTLMHNVNMMSGGDLHLVLKGPGELVPVEDTIDAVIVNRIAAAWAGGGWFASRDSAFTMFSAIPFGPTVNEYLAWMYHGGGLGLARTMFKSLGLHNIPCGLISPEASGWFSKEINSIHDLKGLRMRFFGLGARVMEKFGATTMQLPPADIGPAFERNEIDAAEFSLPAMDHALGVEKHARYYYFPGWHQPATFFDLYVNLQVWDQLSDKQQAVIEVACGDTVRSMLAESEAGQWRVLKLLQQKGVILKRWPPEILVEIENAWHEVEADEAAVNPNFRRVYRSYARFRSNHSIWRYLSYVR
jgi:TRAP-type mannitol/chloroaromatic compound transport system substrate-binding protein